MTHRTPAHPSAAPSAPAPVGPRSRPARSPRGPGRRRRPGTAVAVAVALLVLAALVTACSSGSDDAGSPTSTTGHAATSTAGPDRGDADGSTGTTGGTGASTAPAGTCRGTGSTAHRDLAYGDDSKLQRLDVYVPELPDGCGPAPLVVWVHGGGYATGDKANKVGDKVRLFTGEGYVLAAVDYRLSPNPPSDAPGAVRYPTHQHDVAAALAWLTDHAEEFGIDPDRILLLGHSSGANLVSLLSTDASFLTDAGLDPAQVRCTVSNDTEYDVARQIAQGGTSEALYRNAIGDDPAMWTKASPILQVGDGTDVPPFLVITRGRDQRTTRARAFVDTLTAAGVPAKLLDATPLTHAEVNEHVGAAGDTVVTPAIVDFFADCATGRTPFQG